MRKKTKREQNQKLVEIKRRFGEKNGKPFYKSFYGRNKTEAEAVYNDALRQLHMSEITAEHKQSNITFDECAAKWLKLKHGTVRAISYDKTYESPTERSLIPFFGAMQLKNIKKSDLQLFLNSKSRYSFSELNNLRLCLKGIFSYAIDENLLSRDPTKGLKLPKTATDRIIVKRAYTYAQSRVVASFAKKHKYGVDVLLMLQAGLRRSEMLVLPLVYTEAAGGIDIENNMICVRQSVSESKYGIEISPCKTIKSRRNIPISKDLHALLKEIPDTIKYGDKKFPRKYVVSSSQGNYYRTTNYDRRYNRFKKDFAVFCKAKKLNIPMLTPHELRHSFGSILYERGVDIVTISKLMGHSSVEITAKLYVHDNEELNRNAIKNFS